MAGRWFSPCSPVSSTNKTDCNDMTEILLKGALYTITTHPTPFYFICFQIYDQPFLVQGHFCFDLIISKQVLFNYTCLIFVKDNLLLIKLSVQVFQLPVEFIINVDNWPQNYTLYANFVSIFKYQEICV